MCKLDHALTIVYLVDATGCEVNNGSKISGKKTKNRLKSQVANQRAQTQVSTVAVSSQY